MKLTGKFKILPTKEQEKYLEQTLTEYINTVNNIVPIMINGHKKLTSKDIKANLPSAVKNNVSVIRLEKLTNIRNAARTSRKNEKNLHTWSFYRLMKYIEYKAKLEGIKVEYVNPEYTSQKCPYCGTLNKARDRKYICKSCGYTTHRDRLGAINVMEAPVVDGVA